MNFNVKLVSLFLCSVFFSPVVFSASEQPVDLRIVVDISGETRKAVPDKEHLDAIFLLVNQLPAGSKASIWTYGKYVNHLVKHGRVTPAWLNEAKISIQKIRSVASRRDIYSALKKTAFDIGKQSTYARHILLLSTGGINISDQEENNKASRDYLLTSLAPQLIETGIRVHTLALSETTGVELLRSISKETQGFSFVTNQPSKILNFTNTLANVFLDRNYIPIRNKQFAVDTKITTFTATLFGNPSTIKVASPSGKIFSQKREKEDWLQGNDFVRLQVQKPELGQWQIEGEVNSASRVYVRGGERLEIASLKSEYIASENIPVSVSTKIREKGLEKEIVTKDAELSVNVSGIEGVSGSGISGANGRENFSQAMGLAKNTSSVYQTELQGLNQKGLYALTVVTRALDYERGVDKLFQVNELFNIDVSTEDNQGLLNYKIKIVPADSDLDLNQTNVIATITDSDGEWNVRTVESIGEEGWQLTLEDDKKSVEYKVELDFKGVTVSGRQVHYRPKPLIIELPNTPAAVSTKNASNLSEKGSEQKIIEKVEELEPAKEASDQTAESEAKAEKPRILILIAGICFIVSSALIVLYFWRPGKKPAAQVSEKSNSEKNKPKKIKESPDEEKTVEIEAKSSSNVGATAVIEEEEAAASDTRKSEPESVDTQSTTSLPEEEFTADELVEMGDDTEEDLEIEFDFETDELSEETELASEWQDLDAESNLPSSPDDEIEVDFDVDDIEHPEDNKK